MNEPKQCVAIPGNIFDDPRRPPPFVPTFTVDRTLTDRGQQYGDYGQMAYLAQRLKETMREGSSWDKMGCEKREALEMIVLKIARIVCGNPDFPDSWHDIQGYAKLAEDRCPQTPGLKFTDYTACTCNPIPAGYPHAPGCPAFDATP